MQPFLFNWTSSRDQMKTFSFEVYRTDTCQELDEDDLIAVNNTIELIKKDMERRLDEIFDTPFKATAGKPVLKEYLTNAFLRAGELEKKFTSTKPWKTYVHCGRPGGNLSLPCNSFIFFDTKDGLETFSGQLTFGGEMSGLQ